MKSIINNLDKVLESRIRLGIMSILVVNERIDFNTLKDILEITDGNLASHLTVLEKNRYIQITKQFLGKKPNTSYHATEKGTIAFKQHLDNLENLIKNHK
jgi:DNA-binding HxlR family transcriptional regulator